MILIFDEAVALGTGPPTLVSVCLRWSRISRSVPRYWSLLVIRDKFSTQKVKDALDMAKGRFETIKLYNLFANDLVRLGRILQRASPIVKTLYYETTECSSIVALASLRLKPESLIVRNEDPRGYPIPSDFAALWPILGPTLRSLSFHQLSSFVDNWRQHASLFGHLTSLTITGFRFRGVCLLHHLTMIEEIILDFKHDLFDRDESHIPRPDISLPSLRVFKLRHVPCPTEMSPPITIHAPMLRTFHLESTSADLWLLAFSARSPPTALVDFRVDRPNRSAVSLYNILPFLCDTIESFVLTSVTHELDPLLRNIEAGLLLPRRKHLEFTFHDE